MYSVIACQKRGQLSLRREAGDKTAMRIRELSGPTGLREGKRNRNTGGELLDELRKASGSSQTIVGLTEALTNSPSAAWINVATKSPVSMLPNPAPLLCHHDV